MKKISIDDIFKKEKMNQTIPLQKISKNKATQNASVLLLLSFVFLFFGGILVPQLGIEPVSLQGKLRVLTAGLPGNSQGRQTKPFGRLLSANHEG